MKASLMVSYVRPSRKMVGLGALSFWNSNRFGGAVTSKPEISLARFQMYVLRSSSIRSNVACFIMGAAPLLLLLPFCKCRFLKLGFQSVTDRVQKVRVPNWRLEGLCGL
ncbi:hypothetical protein VNO80_10318 [Phaseolus coccineus]|uniref:Uncharacterized protein n=1 Tax=Phaseolus coccineus TaxID=3886 RepID=A0AAN9ND63_PHACN